MDIKKLYESIINFIIKRIVELFGILLSVFGILLLISLVSYAPEDPNFIFSNEVEIQNFLGLIIYRILTIKSIFYYKHNILTT